MIVSYASLLMYHSVKGVCSNISKLLVKKMDDYCLKVGYSNLHIPLIVDMKKTPHLLVCGLSGSGKSKLVESALQGKKVVLLNSFKDDFKSINPLRRIVGNQNILTFLKNLIDNKKYHEIPLYICIDEILILAKDKKINQTIQDLLAIGRHYNIFVIAISQAGQKEVISYKHLFNARICMRMINNVDYNVVLGITPDNINLKQREFYLLSDDLYRGKSYKV